MKNCDVTGFSSSREEEYPKGEVVGQTFIKQVIIRYHPVTSCHPSSPEEGNQVTAAHYAICKFFILSSSFFISGLRPDKLSFTT